MTQHLHFLTLLGLFSCLSGCSGMMFFPGKTHYLTPAAFDLDYQDVYIDTSDGEKVHGWLVHSVTKKTRGTILFLHGNAENISTHFAGMSWLPCKGYNIFALDYRGYGHSSGTPSLRGDILDIEAAHHWLTKHPNINKSPLYLLGQSMGASLSLTYAGHKRPGYLPFSGVIADAGFPSFPGLAKEKLSEFWLTWPIQHLALLLIESGFDPEKHIASITPVPLMIIHSKQDTIIPLEKGEIIDKLAAQPKRFLITNTPHIATFQQKENREALLDFLQNSVN